MLLVQSYLILNGQEHIKSSETFIIYFNKCVCSWGQFFAEFVTFTNYVLRVFQYFVGSNIHGIKRYMEK